MTQTIDLTPIAVSDLDDHWFTLLLRVWRDVGIAVKCAGVEQKKLAERISMDAGQFNKIITGKKSNVTLRTLHNIARAANHRLQISLVPLADLRKPNYSFEEQGRERLNLSNIKRQTDELTEGAWTPAKSESKPLEAVT